MIELITQYLQECVDTYELCENQIARKASFAANELKINFSEAELKVVQESGGQSDLDYLYELAAKEYVDKLKEIISDIRDAIVRFFEEIKNKIIVFLTDDEVTKTVDAIEKKLKFIPFVGKKKILVEDYGKHKKNADEHMSLLFKLKAKFLSGRKVELEEVSKIEESFLERNKALIGVAAATTTTLAAAIVLVKKMGQSANKVLKENYDNAKKACDDIAKSAVEEIQNVQIGASIARMAGMISKVNQENFIRCWKGTLSTVKSSVNSIGKTKLDVKSVLKENAKDEVLTEKSDDLFFSLADNIFEDTSYKNMYEDADEDLDDLLNNTEEKEKDIEDEINDIDDALDSSDDKDILDDKDDDEDDEYVTDDIADIIEISDEKKHKTPKDVDDIDEDDIESALKMADENCHKIEECYNGNNNFEIDSFVESLLAESSDTHLNEYDKLMDSINNLF